MMFLEIFFVLLMVHAVCDFGLQNDFMAQAKNRNTALGEFHWKIVLPAHGLIHAAGVFMFTGLISASIIQFVTHCIIDYLKGECYYGFYVDQLLHTIVMFVIALVYMFTFYWV